MRRPAAVPLLALCVVVAGSSSTAVAQTATASIAGTVTDAGGAPVAGVCVDVFGESGPDSALTDGDGAYRVDGLGPGDHFVAFNSCADPRPGLAGEYFEDAAGFADADPVALDEGEQRAGVDAALEPAATITGTVSDEDSDAPLAEVCVVAFEAQSGQVAFDTTDDAGTYTLATLRGGDYLLSFTDCGDPFLHRPELYDDVSEQDFIAGEQPDTVTVEAGATRSDVDAQLEEGGSLRGTVTGLHHGQPLSLVCAALTAPGGDEAVASTVTGFGPGLDGTPTPGEYVFAGVQPGSYDVVINPDDLCGDDGYAEQRADGPARQVAKGEVVEGVDVVLAPRPSTSVACFTDGQPTSPFPDVPSDSVHAAAIDCAAGYGIAGGRSDGSYGPAETVSRDQMAAFVARTLEAVGVALPADPPDAFTDDGQSVHHLAINQLAALGVVGGKGGGRYAPAEPVNRDQMATFLVNAYQEATGFTLRAVGDAFTDDEASTHEQSIDKAATAGLTAGSGAGRYAPEGTVRRDQMATFTARLLDRVQRDVAATATGQTSEASVQASSSGPAAPSGPGGAAGAPPRPAAAAGFPWGAPALRPGV